MDEPNHSRHVAQKLASLELAILGGGPAGMAAALIAGRARLATLVVNAEAPRNAVTKASHGEAVYGSSVYPCPFCDGFEHADEKLALFGDEGIEHFAPVVRIWSKDIAVFTNGVALSAAAKEVLATRGVPVFEQRVVQLTSDAGQLRSVELEGGQVVLRDSGFVSADFSLPATDFAESLGVKKKVGDWGMEVLDADTAGKTNVLKLYVVGDAKSGFGGLTAAASEGASCVEHIVHEIAQERWREAKADG